MIKPGTYLILALSLALGCSVLHRAYGDEDIFALEATDEPINIEISGAGNGEENGELADLVPGLDMGQDVDKDDIRKPENGITTMDKLICGGHYNRVYSKINDMLIKELPDGRLDIAMAMQKAKEKLEMERLRPGISNRCTIPALEQFTALAEPGKENDCSWERFKIIYSNDRATKGKTHTPPSKLPNMSRLEQIIHTYAMQHAINCHHTYPAKFNQIYQKIDTSKVQNVELFTNRVMKRYELKQNRFWIFDFGNSKVDISKMLREIRSLHNKEDGQIAYDMISELAVNDPDNYFLHLVPNPINGKPEMRRDKIKEMLRRYIVEPCEYYWKQFGPTVFIPAAYDVTLLEKEDRYQVKEDDKEMLYFMNGWVRYRICDLLINDQDKLSRKVADTGAIMSKGRVLSH